MFIYALYTFVVMHTPQRTGLEAKMKLDICFRALKVSTRMGTLNKGGTRAFNKFRSLTLVNGFSPIFAIRLFLQKSYNTIVKKVPSSSIVLASNG